MLELLQKHQFYCKLKKCAFFQPSASFLGHVVDANGLHIDSKKLAAVKDWPEPSSVKEIQKFLGFCNFFRRFIKGYSDVAWLLT